MVGLCCAGPTSLTDMLGDKEGGSIWALLVAGSNTWMNYRHQVNFAYIYTRNCYANINVFINKHNIIM